MTDQGNMNMSQSDTDMGLVAYICFAVSAIPGLQLVALAGLFIAYNQLGKDHPEWLQTHFTWMIRTFWLGLALIVLATLVSFFTFGLLSGLAFGVVFVWYVIRLFVGWRGHSKGIAMADPNSYLFG